MTIAFLFLLQIVATNWPSLTQGTAVITLPLPMWSVDIQNWPFYYSLVALLGASLLMSWRIRRTKFGMGLVAMREDEDKAATVGVNTPTYKMLAFVASAVPLSMAGGGFALSPDLHLPPGGVVNRVSGVHNLSRPPWRGGA